MDLRQYLRGRLFDALYGRLAAQYDRVSALAFAGEWAAWQAVVPRLIDRTPVVEVGCGTGRLLALLQQAGIPAHGFDISRPMLQRACQRVSGRLCQADARALPLRAASVGTLVSVFPAPYIFQLAVWQEAHRVLAPGGRLIILDYGWLAPRDPWRLALNGLHRLVYGNGAEPVPPPPFPAWCSVLALQERSRHGFVSVWLATRPMEPVRQVVDG